MCIDQANLPSAVELNAILDQLEELLTNGIATGVYASYVKEAIGALETVLDAVDNS